MTTTTMARVAIARARVASSSGARAATATATATATRRRRATRARALDDASEDEVARAIDASIETLEARTAREIEAMMASDASVRAEAERAGRDAYNTKKYFYSIHMDQRSVYSDKSNQTIMQQISIDHNQKEG